MKSIVAVVACAYAAVAAGCARIPDENTLDFLNLKGEVKVASSRVYTAAERGGEVLKGERADYAGMNSIRRFDRKGRLVQVETFGSSEDITSWEDYFYAPDGRLDKVVLHSVFFNGDRTAELEWSDDTGYLRTTYDEQGDTVAQERFTRKGNRTQRMVASAQDTVVVVTRYRKGRPGVSERLSAGGSVETRYEYGRKGDPTAVISRIDGAVCVRDEMEYTAYDKRGNWTERVYYEIDDEGKRFPAYIEERRIEYYRSPDFAGR